MNTYDELTAHLRRTHTLETVGELLGWDEQVNLPEGAAGRRAEQMAALAEVAHASTCDARVGRWLDELEKQGNGDAAKAAVVRQARRDYDRATRLPAEFVKEKAEAQSHGFHVWAKARANNDFASYIPVLEKHLDLSRREASFMGKGGAVYDYQLDLFDPGMTEAAVEGLFGPLRRELVPFARQIVAATEKRPAPALGAWSVAAQEAFLREVTAKLGFDYKRGRIDTSLHPFCSGTGVDVRMTTRFKPEAPLSALFGSIHETGHGLYEQGMADEVRGTALGLAAGMAVHESQSRLWENQVGRSRGFWKFFEPRARAVAPQALEGLTSDDLFRAVNRVKLSSIRVEADEVTYNLHVILRFEMERRLFAGKLAVKDLPAAWRAAAAEIIGLEPASDKEGVLQDVHWSGGMFGYFPSYTIGNMMASQLWYAALAERPALEEDFARGEFGWLLSWLRSKVHSEGRKQDGLALIQKVTGKPLTPQPLLRYLRERYGALYLQ
ncbi:MAG TPA: carboxypeptidase M32 [Opitutaceae bacterium]|nr:carboxypeptidase M32 [Opitutaceae bacterium]